jgi:hypothetical protein
LRQNNYHTVTPYLTSFPLAFDGASKTTAAAQQTRVVRLDHSDIQGTLHPSLFSIPLNSVFSKPEKQRNEKALQRLQILKPSFIFFYTLQCTTTPRA